ncbi:MAG: cation:proton antiporter [Candidatus Zixiibacteriota bacterium]
MYILQDLVLIFAASVAGLLVCHRLKLPPIVGFLIAGLAIGPHGFSLIHSPHEVDMLAEIGVILLLFAIGIEFSVKDLLHSSRSALLGGGLQVVLTIVVVTLLVAWLDFTLSQAVFAGFLVSLSSTAIVLKALQDRAELDSANGRVTLAILIFQDIIIAPMMIITPVLSGADSGLTESLFRLLFKGLIVVILVVVLARYLVPTVLYQVARTRSRELFLLSVVLIGMAVAWSTFELGLSLGLGAFLAGLIISDSEYSSQALEGVLPFKAVFTGFFFVSIGMLLDTSTVLSHPGAVFGGGLLVILIKTIIAAGVALALGMSSRAAIIIGLALGQVGEFSFILSKVGLSSGLIDSGHYQLFLAVAILTMGLTPFLISLAPSVAAAVSSWPFLRRFESGSYRGLAGGREGDQAIENHLVIIGFGLNGRNIARAAKAAGIRYVIVEMNPDTVRAVKAEGEPIRYGDASSRELLKEVAIERARIVVIAISDPITSRRITHTIRELSPRVYIIVRTRFVIEMAALYENGANEVIPEEFETSVEIFTRVLTKYLVPRDDIEKLTAELRSHSYEMFRSLTPRSPSLGDLQVHLSEIEISAVKVGSTCPALGQTLAEARLRNRFGVNVLAIMRGAKLISNPAGDVRLEPGDLLYVVGTAAQCNEVALALAD